MLHSLVEFSAGKKASSNVQSALRCQLENIESDNYPFITNSLSHLFNFDFPGIITTLFVHSFQPLKFKPGVSPSVLWDLLLLVEQQIISKATANTYIDNNNDNEELLLEDVLSMKKHDKKRWIKQKQGYKECKHTFLNDS